MHSYISKWGNTLVARIPRVIAQQIGISEGTLVELIVEDDHILIQRKTHHLNSLLAKVTPENIHREIDFGTATGCE